MTNWQRAWQKTSTGQTTVCNTQHIKLKTDQQEPHEKPEVPWSLASNWTIDNLFI